MTFEPSSINIHAGAREYDVVLTLTVIVDLNTAGINVEQLLRDAAGKIVGADWGDTGKFPSRLADRLSKLHKLVMR